MVDQPPPCFSARWSASMSVLEKQEAADQRSRRSGGREARRAMRAAPLADDIKPVRAGLEGGSYGPLTRNDQERIHEAVLTLLERVGFANAIPSCIEALTRAGRPQQSASWTFRP